MDKSAAPPVPYFTSLYTLLLFRIISIVFFLYLLKVRVFLPAYFLLLLILIVESAGIWSKTGFNKLKVNIKFKPSRLFPGEVACFSLTLKNEKRLPVLLHWTQSFSPQVQALANTTKIIEDISGQGYLGSFAETTTNYTIKVDKRGCYEMSPLRLYCRDVLGLFYREALRGESAELMVYPKLMALEDILFQPSDFSGLERDNRPFLYDPIMFVGLREYTPDLPTKFIHWKASAHQDRLLAKIIEASADLQILVAVDVETYLLPEPQEELFEQALSIAATLTVWADSQKIPYGFIGNMTQKKKNGAPIIPVNRDLNQGARILESLARAEFAVCDSLENIFKKEALHFPWGAILIVIGNSQELIIPSSISQVIFLPVENATGGNL